MQKESLTFGVWDGLNAVLKQTNKQKKQRHFDSGGLKTFVGFPKKLNKLKLITVTLSQSFITFSVISNKH